MVRHRLGTGAWLRLLRSDVFTLPSHAGTWERQCMAATLCVDGLISGATAAALHGFTGWPRARIEVVTRGPRRRSAFGAVHRCTSISRHVVVHGIPTVSPEDCLVQLASSHRDPRRIAAVVDDAVADGRVDLDLLRALVARLRTPGIGVLRAVVEERGEGWVPPSNLLERHLVAVLTTIPDVPGWSWQAPAPWWARGPGRVDAVIPEWALIVEADGRRWHTRAADFDRDRWRDNQAAAHGFAVLRFTWRHLSTDIDGCRRLVVETSRHRRPQPAPLSLAVAA